MSAIRNFARIVGRLPIHFWGIGRMKVRVHAGVTAKWGQPEEKSDMPVFKSITWPELLALMIVAPQSGRVSNCCGLKHSPLEPGEPLSVQ